jgi:hypothetical protein
MDAATASIIAAAISAVASVAVALITNRNRGQQGGAQGRWLGVAVGVGTFAAAAFGIGWWLFRQPIPTQQPSLASQHSERKAEPRIGGPFVPPPNRSYWLVDNSVVYQEPSGGLRKYIFVEPSPELVSLGVESGALLFDGQKTDNIYEGKAYIFAGRCGSFPYLVRGVILNAEETSFEVGGKAPVYDTQTCKPTGLRDVKLIFNFKDRH